VNVAKGTGKMVECNACRGAGWYYPGNTFANIAGEWYPQPTVCAYCAGTGKREVVQWVDEEKPAI